MYEIQEYIFLVEFYLDQWNKETNPILKQYFKAIYFDRKEHLKKLILAQKTNEKKQKPIKQL